jgi:aldose 1-epimerase
MSVQKREFGVAKDCKAVELYTIKNEAGASVEVITYGATMQALTMPDRNGKFADVTIGFDDLKGHMERSNYQGQTVGRYANRIANGEFGINGKFYHTTKNEKGTTCLHGGGEFSHTVWDVLSAGDDFVKLGYTSPAGSHGFPGELKTEVTYTLTAGNELILDFYAVADEDTVINLTNHAYFNLGGFDAGSVLGHILQVNAACFTPTDEKSIPTGELRPVKGTPFNFTLPKTIGLDIGTDYDQLNNCKGYDHNFCLDEPSTDTPAVKVWEPEKRTGHGSLHRLARRSALYRQLFSGCAGQKRHGNGQARRFLFGDAVLPRYA